MKTIDGRRSYVAGRWVEGERSFEVENPADESCFAVAGVTPLPGDPAGDLGGTTVIRSGCLGGPPGRRAGQDPPCLSRPRRGLSGALIDTIMGEAGQPRMMAQGAQVAMGLTLGRQTIDLYQALSHEEANPVPLDDLVRGKVTLSIRRHEPIGVVSAITPYNGAIIMAFQKLIPALMAGNSVILRPSPLTPLSSLVFGTAADAAGLPAGVLSVVVEDGAEGAELLTTDPAIDMVSFTGSTAVGRQILAQAAPTVKRVSLELGGKSAQIYLDDAIERAGMGAMAVVAMTSGQACVAATRMLVPNERKAEVIEAVCATYGMISVGDPTDPDESHGPSDQCRPTRALRALHRPRRGARGQGRLRRWASGRSRQGLLRRAHRPRPARQHQPGGAKTRSSAR